MRHRSEHQYSRLYLLRHQTVVWRSYLYRNPMDRSICTPLFPHPLYWYAGEGSTWRASSQEPWTPQLLPSRDKKSHAAINDSTLVKCHVREVCHIKMWLLSSWLIPTIIRYERSDKKSCLGESRGKTGELHQQPRLWRPIVDNRREWFENKMAVDLEDVD